MSKNLKKALSMLPPPPKDTLSLRLLINPREVAYLSAIFEAYPGYALIRAEDPKKGIVRLWIAPDFYKETLEVLHGLQKEIVLKILDPEPLNES